jgi:membrane dipeptidase
VPLVVILLTAVVVLAAGGAGVLRLVALHQDRVMNQVGQPPPYRASEDARALHGRLFVADLHADSLLWRRDLLRRSGHGHLDLPRLREANVALQVFASVTQVPAGINVERIRANRDLITVLAIAQGWPPRTWRSRTERARYAAQRLRHIAERSGGRLLLIRSGADLDRLDARRQEDPGVVGALLAIEGSHALDGRLDRLDHLYQDGFRMIGLQHFLDNDAGGSAHGLSGGGLTAFGRDLVRRMAARHMIVDVAHSSPAVVADVLAMTTRPVFVSHTGLVGTCDNQRNLSDEHARRVASTGGVIGIAMFARAVCGTSVTDTARAMRYGADLVGVRHIALGTDFDGTVRTPVDVTGLELLTEGLLREGFDEAEIAMIMGGNVRRALRRALPPS